MKIHQGNGYKDRERWVQKDRLNQGEGEVDWEGKAKKNLKFGA